MRKSLVSRFTTWWIYLPCDGTVSRSGPKAKAWAHFWARTFDVVGRAWRRGLRPHLMPRRHAREHYESWVDFRLPARVEGYVWAEHGEGWIGVFRFVGGPVEMELCCFHGETEQECQDAIMDFLRDCEKNAGQYGKGWEVAWFQHEPSERNR